MIVLASASPRRRELLSQVGVQFTVQTADIDETPLPGEDHRTYTQRLAEAKARIVLNSNPDSIVIGADTTVTIDGHLLGKPQDALDAERMLQRLQGRAHQVSTGVAVLSRTQTLLHVETTDVVVAPMSAEDIRLYVATGEPMDKAGGYGIQGNFAQWIPRIEGDYFNVVGLPLAAVAAMLRQMR